MRCKTKKQNGKRCKVSVLKGENKCLFHSNSKRAKEIREKRNPKRILDNSELIVILQKELKRVRKKKGDEIARSGEIRKLVELIYEIRGEKPPANDGKKSLTFAERVDRAQQRKQNESS